MAAGTQGYATEAPAYSAGWRGRQQNNSTTIYNNMPTHTLQHHITTDPMKHIFVVNPKAGGIDRTQQVAEKVHAALADAEVYVTQAPCDATRFAAERLRQSDGEPLRFDACGGDGTLNEVAAGVAGSTAEVACWPLGSGNDYIKCWPDADFGSLEALVGGSVTPVDIMRVNNRYCLNVLNFGFEAEVCRTMQTVRRWPLVGGSMAYTTGIVHSLMHAMHTPCRISVDGEPWQQGDMLLGSSASGQYVGGGYRCAPRAVVDDGWLEVLCVDSIHLPRFLNVIGYYRQGRHLDMPQLADIIHYRRGHRVCFGADADFSVVVDGELMRGQRFDVECLPRALRFVVPASSHRTARQNNIE